MYIEVNVYLTHFIESDFLLNCYISFDYFYFFLYFHYHNTYSYFCLSRFDIWVISGPSFIENCIYILFCVCLKFVLEYSCFKILCFCCTAKWIKCTFLYMYIFHLFGCPPHLGHQRHWVEFSVLNSRISLVIHFIHSSVYMLIPILQFIPNPPFFP